MEHLNRMTAIIISGILFLCISSSCATDGNPKDSTMNYWDKKKGDCEEVLKSPHAYGLSQISYCTKLWETYRYVDNINLKERSMYAVAFSTVSHQSPDPYDRGVADAALARICIPRHPLDANGNVKEVMPASLECNTNVTDISIAGQDMSSNNRFERMKGSVEIEEVSDKDFKASKVAYKEGVRLRKKKEYSKAASYYREALASNPYNVSAKYELAAVLALQDDEQGALYELEGLYSWNDAEAEQRLGDARYSSDFDNIRDNPNFKLMTGYVRVAIINGAKSLGDSKVLEMKKKLETSNIPVAEIGRSHRVEMQPQIWYREGFEDYAEKIKNIVGLRKTSLSLLKRSDLRDNDTGNDVLVVWGQPEASAESDVGNSEPIVTGGPTIGSKNKLDDILKEGEQRKQSLDAAQQVGESVKDTSF